MLRTGRWRVVDLPMMVGLLEHRTEGLVLFDAGYGTALHQATEPLSNRAYRWLAPYQITEQTTAAGRLRALGLDPRAVRHVILSHFHPDHIGGARDFPNATLHASWTAWRTVADLSGLRRRLGAWFPELLPPDFLDRVCWVDPQGEDEVDWLGDGSLRMLALPGHARGQLGLRATLPGGHQVLFAADASWTSRGIREEQPASWLATSILDDAGAARQTLRRLHNLSVDPGLDIVPSHCPEQGERRWLAPER